MLSSAEEPKRMSSPEQQLWAAVIQQAMEELLAPMPTGKKTRSLYERLKRWRNHRDSAHCFLFSNREDYRQHRSFVFAAAGFDPCIEVMEDLRERYKALSKEFRQVEAEL